MSFFAKLLGDGKKKKDGDPVSTQTAIQKLHDMEEMLNKKQDFLEQKIESETDTAKRMASKNKRVALQALKRRKKYEAQLKQIDGTLTTIEYQRETLENASTSAEVLQTMNIAASAMKSAHKHMDVDQINDMMDDIQEQNDIANQISEAISNPIGFGQDIDQDELEKELEELEGAELTEELLKIGDPVTDQLPEVPTAEPKKSVKTKAEADEDDLRALEAWAS